MLTFQECFQMLKRCKTPQDGKRIGRYTLLRDREDCYAITYDGTDLIRIYPDNSFQIHLDTAGRGERAWVKRLTPVIIKKRRSGRDRLISFWTKDDKYICMYSRDIRFDSKGKVVSNVSYFQEPRRRQTPQIPR